MYICYSYSPYSFDRKTLNNYVIMEIKTNHEINERRWILYQNAVQSISIISIHITCEKGLNPFISSTICEILYRCRCDKILGFTPSYLTLSEKDLERKTFATKEELIKHL